MVESVITSETSVSLCKTTWRNIPEDGHLHTRLKSHSAHFKTMGQ